MTPPTGPKPNIILVDDDENVLRSLRVALRRSYDLRCCSNALQALGEFKRERPLVVVTDIKMPNEDGFWLFRELRRLDPNVPVIFNSAFQETMSEADVAMGLRPFGYLPKTGSLVDFTLLVDRAVAHAQKAEHGKKG